LRKCSSSFSTKALCKTCLLISPFKAFKSRTSGVTSWVTSPVTSGVPSDAAGAKLTNTEPASSVHVGGGLPFSAHQLMGDVHKKLRNLTGVQ
jgi:hypothetical protein